MPWTYQQGTGLLTDPFGQPFARGYSGTGIGRNNPGMESVRNVGPLPRGKYSLSKAYRHMELGELTMNLDAILPTDTHGRSAFRVHGNNAQDDASHGCIILDLPQRQVLALAKDRVLEVVE